jgi:hypothetical protein
MFNFMSTNFKHLIFVISWFATPLILYGQHYDSDTTKLIADISKKTRLLINKNIINWDSNDYKTISSNIANSNDSKAKQYLSDLTLRDFDTIILYVSNIILNNTFNKTNSVQTQFWKKNSLPHNARLFETIKYEKKAGKKIIIFPMNYLSGYCAISKPIFSTDKLFAIIKVDFSALQLNSNTCQIDYFYCKKKYDSWQIELIRGTNCMIE